MVTDRVATTLLVIAAFGFSARCSESRVVDVDPASRCRGTPALILPYGSSRCCSSLWPAADGRIGSSVSALSVRVPDACVARYL